MSVDLPVRWFRATAYGYSRRLDRRAPRPRSGYAAHRISHVMFLSPARAGLSHMVVPRRLDRSAKRGAERPSLNDKLPIVERRSLRSALRASVETTEISNAMALPARGRVRG